MTSALRGFALAFAVAAGAMLAVGGGACHEGNGLGLGDLAEGPDMLPEPDLLPPVDMVPPPNCGKIVFCALGCLGGGGIPGVGGGGGAAPDGGANAINCVLGCGQNAATSQIAAAGALVLCAAQNCLAGDGGSGAGQLGVLQCLQSKCPMQLAGCQGLGIGG